MVSGVLFLDLKKAFDSVDHKILLHKLKLAGLTEASVSWFRSYLNNRYQVTRVNGVLSEEERVEYGVSQGLILGPLLFVIYINYLPLHMNECRVHLYTDGTAISVRAVNVEDLETKQASGSQLMDDKKQVNSEAKKDQLHGLWHITYPVNCKQRSSCNSSQWS